MNRKRMFQHAAARRRLANSYDVDVRILRVSTRSRPKAAGSRHWWKPYQQACFNTQPPEGGWIGSVVASFTAFGFQHAAARRRLGSTSAT